MALVHVGILKIDFQIPESRTLKEKRMVLQRLKDGVRNVFNVSIAEIGHHDKWQIASLGISCVANEKRHIDGTLNRVKNFFESKRYIFVIDCSMEII
ncbi:MAG: DUF503 domain-containing protein [Candidatus Omnitrophica bacterium]|nr:DUF503 domain-containing protein [Candidatus Omnitrophota bacterium]